MKLYKGIFKANYSEDEVFNSKFYKLDFGEYYADNKEDAIKFFEYVGQIYIEQGYILEVYEISTIKNISNTTCTKKEVKVNKEFKSKYPEKLELPLYSLESMEHNIQSMGNETVLDVIEKIKDYKVRLKYRKLFLKAGGQYE